MKLKRKKIVMVIPDLKGNGAERVVLTLASGFKKNNCEVHIVVFNKTIELEMEDTFPIHTFKRYYRWIPKIFRGTILAPFLDHFIIKNCGVPDLVLSNLYPSDILMSRSKLNNVFFVIHNTLSDELLKGLFPSKQTKLLSQLRSTYLKKPTISVSQGVKKDFDLTFNPKYSSNYIYNPVDMDFIRSSAEEYIPEYTNYIVHVGKFKQQKRHDILIRAYHESAISTPLLLLGQGPLLEQSKALVKELGIEDKVIFAGFQSNPYPYIKHAKLMVLSSDFEGLPTVILEALALNTPVISTDCPSGPNEMLPHMNLCKVGDIDKLSVLIQNADINPEAYKTHLKEDFLLEYATKKYLDLL